MTRMHMAIAGAFFGALFAIGSIARGDVAPGLVGGALGGVLVYIVLQRVQQHHDALRQRQTRHDRDLTKAREESDR